MTTSVVFGEHVAKNLELLVALKGPISDLAKVQNRFVKMHNACKG